MPVHKHLKAGLNSQHIVSLKFNFSNRFGACHPVSQFHNLKTSTDLWPLPHRPTYPLRHNPTLQPHYPTPQHLSLTPQPLYPIPQPQNPTLQHQNLTLPPPRNPTLPHLHLTLPQPHHPMLKYHKQFPQKSLTISPPWLHMLTRPDLKTMPFENTNSNNNNNNSFNKRQNNNISPNNPTDTCLP